MEQFTTIDESEYEIKFLCVLEREFEGYDEGIVDLCENGSFGESVSYFGSRDDVSFSNRLQGVDSSGILLAYLHDLLKSLRISSGIVD